MVIIKNKIWNPDRAVNKLRKEQIIRNNLKNTNDIIYGARAMNKQLSPFLRRPTEDFDIYSKTPKKRAKKMERVLNKSIKSDDYYVKPAIHKGTWKVMDKGADKKKGTKDDYGVIDYTKPERKIKTIIYHGINYARLSERKKDANRSLKDKMFFFRHEKDRKDLHRIKIQRKIRRWL